VVIAAFMGAVLGIISGYFIFNLIGIQSSNGSADLSSIHEKLSVIESRVALMETRISEIKHDIDRIETKQQMESAYIIFRKNLAQPGTTISNQIVDEIFEELSSSNNEIVRWTAVVGSSMAKSTVSKIVNSQIPSLVWNPHSISKQGSSIYAASMITYFPLEIDTGLPIIGDITIAKIGLVVSGDIDLESQMVSNLRLLDITI
jgi:hypothetical protein